MGDLDQFERVAVLDDGAVLRGLAKAAGALDPGVDMQVFEADERQQAMAWLNQADAESGAR